MTEISIIGLDLAKRVFQLHGARADCKSARGHDADRRGVKHISD